MRNQNYFNRAEEQKNFHFWWNRLVVSGNHQLESKESSLLVLIFLQHKQKINLMGTRIGSSKWIKTRVEANIHYNWEKRNKSLCIRRGVKNTALGCASYRYRPKDCLIMLCLGWIFCCCLFFGLIGFLLVYFDFQYCDLMG